MASAVGVVHLGYDVLQCSACIVAPVQADGVEHVPEDPGLEQRGDSAAPQFDASFGEKCVDALPQCVIRPVSFTEVIACFEPRERPQPSGKLRQVVDVDVPAVPAMLEVVVHGGATQMCDPRAVDGGRQHGTTWRARAGHSTPRRCAARNPDAAPSSWKPHP